MFKLFKASQTPKAHRSMLVQVPLEPAKWREFQCSSQMSFDLSQLLDSSCANIIGCHYRFNDW